MNPKLALLLFLPIAASAQCDLTAYKPAPGLTATQSGDSLVVTWTGERAEQLHAVFGLKFGQPTILELAARKTPAAKWTILGNSLAPEFQVTTGKRRLSEQQMAPLRELGIALTPDVIEKEKWFAFWDAPLSIPGRTGTNLDLPRKQEEIRRDHATFHGTTCKVESNGARLEVSFPGVELGIFSGELRYTAYRGSNLLRQEVIASTKEQSVAYKYDGGLKGFQIRDDSTLVWRDSARGWQQYGFGGSPNQEGVGLQARNRLAILQTNGGSLAVLPPSHKFFFAREIETNLGYVYYRKDTEKSFAIGARQPEREEAFRPAGVSDAVWTRRVAEARGDIHNYALYNAPPGTNQRMAVYFYLSPRDAKTTQPDIMAYTHDDVYKPVPGFKVLVSHFHFHFNEQLSDAGMDYQPSWLPTFRALGINIAILADFHSDSHPTDIGRLRLDEQKVYFEGSRRFSDRDFLLIPGEEPDANFGGHYMFVFPKPVYFTHLRKPPVAPTQPFQETISGFGKVYHTTTAANELELLKQENGFVWQTHPRTKASAGYPDATKDTDFFNSDRFLGGSFQSLPVDQSEKRICEGRCLKLLDDMNNWSGPKYMISEGDTYMKHPDDETYPQLVVNYVKLASVPKFDDGWDPVLKAMRAGDFYNTTGEVLLRNWSIQGQGSQSAFNAEVEWTFPPEFAEVVWGDGTTVDRKILDLTTMAPLAARKLSIPFDATGKKWVRFAVWDSAGNGAITQPVHLR